MTDVELALNIIGGRPDLLIYGGDDTERFGDAPFEEYLTELEYDPQHPVWSQIFPAEQGDQGPFVGHCRWWMTLALPLEEGQDSLAAVSFGLLHRLWQMEATSARVSSPSCYRWQRMFQFLGKPNSVHALREAILKRCTLAHVLRGRRWYAIFCLKEREARPNTFERLAKRARLGLAGVIGNDCFPWDRLILNAPDVRNLHSRPLRCGRFGVIGLEASPGPMGAITYDENAAARHLRASAERFPPGAPLIVVSHAPPYGVLDLAARFGVDRIGSRALRAFMREHDVRLVLCGHVHSQGGQVQRIGNCWVVNTANHDDKDAKGRVASIDIEGGSIQRVEWLLPHTYKTRALVECGSSRTERLEKAGIRLWRDVLDTPAEELAAASGAQPKIVRKWLLHARALQEKRFLPLESPFIPKPFPPRIIYYDIETLPSGFGEQIWLIGALQPGASKVVQFLAKKPSEERAILEDFMGLIDAQPDATLVCYSGSNFDHRILASRLRHKRPKHCGRFDARTKLDLQTYIKSQVVPPCAGYGLKEMAEATGIPMRHSMGGYLLSMAYLESIRPQGGRLAFSWKKALQYNEDDVLAMPRLLRRLYEDMEKFADSPLGHPAMASSRQFRELSQHGLTLALSEWGPSWKME
ncbi:ribonuclease H-like domain-containing protein [Archangium violaceum]|uniref:ribonuclease H-like domain-containing protein n=1 Tax=Archangium violaceum TaxID=83451 RepID=UPI002B2C1BB3|nr:ribonuclease H-like domain-containing protein [Archangium gephyra]